MEAIVINSNYDFESALILQRKMNAKRILIDVKKSEEKMDSFQYSKNASNCL